MNKEKVNYRLFNVAVLDRLVKEKVKGTLDLTKYKPLKIKLRRIIKRYNKDYKGIINNINRSKLNEEISNRNKDKMRKIKKYISNYLNSSHYYSRIYELFKSKKHLKRQQKIIRLLQKISSNISNNPKYENRRKKILKNLDKSNFSNIKKIKNKYKNLELDNDFYKPQKFKIPDDYNSGNYNKILVVGETGSGKSALCWSLTGDDNFISSNSAKSETQYYTRGFIKHNGNNYEFIDMPGFNASKNNYISHKKSIMIFKKLINEIDGLNLIILMYKIRLKESFNKNLKLIHKIAKNVPIILIRNEKIREKHINKRIEENNRIKNYSDVYLPGKNKINFMTKSNEISNSIKQKISTSKKKMFDLIDKNKSNKLIKVNLNILQKATMSISEIFNPD